MDNRLSLAYYHQIITPIFLCMPCKREGWMKQDYLKWNLQWEMVSWTGGRKGIGMKLGIDKTQGIALGAWDHRHACDMCSGFPISSYVQNSKNVCTLRRPPLTSWCTWMSLPWLCFPLIFPSGWPRHRIIQITHSGFVAYSVCWTFDMIRWRCVLCYPSFGCCHGSWTMSIMAVQHL